MNATAWFVIVVAAVVVAIVGYGMARRARGSIEVSLPKDGFEPGETIHGRVDVHAKQPIEGERLVVTVTATEITETLKEGKTTSTSKQVFRGESVLEGARAYRAGTREVREFDLTLPEPKPTQVPASAVGHVGFDKLKSMARPRVRLQWRLEARLVAKGIDLVTVRPLTVNLETL
ncbi:MAG: hypothetical protein P1P87_01870 [Trueperaceae bacterium]|nr:hypothetical protein [Trueperaceae bacterium]